jgi:hypothetical protein
MHTHKRYILLSLTILWIFLFSLMSPIPVQADDLPPTDGPTAVETPTPDLPDSTPVPEVTTTEEVLTAEPPTPQPEEVQPASQEETISLPEVIEQAPENTAVVILDETGETEPLATVEAAEVLVTSDPFWCPNGTSPVPGTGGCTNSFATFTDLLTFLDANDTGAGFQRNGTIFVTSGTYGGGEAAININGAAYGTMQNYSITLQGGWNSSTNTVDSTSSFTAPITITWNGSVFVNDISISGTSATGLNATSNNNIGVDHVTVTVTGSNDAAALVASGNINVTNSSFHSTGGTGAIMSGNRVSVSGSSFDNSGGDGLYIQAGSHVTLNQVSASQNDLVGATIITPNGNVSITNSFFNDNLTGTGDSSTGLYIVVFDGNITLNTVEVTGNGTGALLYTIGNINIFSSHFDGNIAGSGLEATTEYAGFGSLTTGIADVNIANSTFSNNGSALAVGEYAAGAEIAAPGQVSLVNVIANDNHDDGLGIYSGLNTIMRNVIANNNGWTGAYVETDCNFYSVSGGQYNSNGPGQDGQGFGIWTNGVANGVKFTSMPGFSGNFTGNVFEENICLVPVSAEESGSPQPTVTPITVGNLLIVPIDDGETLAVPCIDMLVALLLPSGHRVIFDNLCGYSAALYELGEDGLPGNIPEDLTYVGGLDFKIYKDSKETSSPPNGALIKVSFLLPEETYNGQFSIYHWDGAQWIEVDPGTLSMTGDGYLEAPVESAGTYIIVNR